jgi:hypothetical protein
MRYVFIILVFLFLSGNISAQQEINSKARSGKKVEFQLEIFSIHLNYPIAHVPLLFGIEIKKHSLLIGPELNILFRNFKDYDRFNRTMEVSRLGLMLVYKFLLLEAGKTALNLQMSNSLYKGEYGYSSPGGGSESEDYVGEIMLGFRLDYQYSAPASLFIIIGGGGYFSKTGAFDKMLIHAAMGICFKLGKKQHE